MTPNLVNFYWFEVLLIWSNKDQYDLLPEIERIFLQDTFVQILRDYTGIARMGIVTWWWFWVCAEMEKNEEDVKDRDNVI